MEAYRHTNVAGREPVGHRMDRLQEEIEEYRKVVETIPTGLNKRDSIQAQKEKILQTLGAKEEDWNSSAWQLANRFTDSGSIARILSLTVEEQE